MYAHHKRAIARISERMQADPDVLALVIIGSVARGDASAGSDLDGYLVLTDTAYQARQAAGVQSWSADELCDWPGAAAGGLIVALAMFADLAERGPEPARYAFTGAFAAFSSVPDLDVLLQRIPVYPEHERTEKLISFASQLPVHLAYLRLGEYSGNAYLLAETAVELVRFGGRLILAHNRMLYPSRKWFMRELARAPEQPPGLLDLAERLIQTPSIAHAQAFCDAVLGFAPWPRPPEGTLARFQRDRELHWRSGPAPLGER
jgi:hypothetical protein